jgi:SM-20-related protein
MLENFDRTSPWDRAAGELATRGFYTTDGYLAPELVGRLRAEALESFAGGEFRAARVGAGAERVLAPSVRRDWIQWLDPAALTPAQSEVADALEKLRVAINRTTFMGLFEWEAHLALYPPGSFYKRHVDVFRAHRERKVTFIFYLNPAWKPGDGGELRVYADATTATDYFDVEPRAGTLVLFFSEECHHEVLPSHCDRATLTGWFRVRA